MLLAPPNIFASSTPRGASTAPLMDRPLFSGQHPVWIDWPQSTTPSASKKKPEQESGKDAQAEAEKAAHEEREREREAETRRALEAQGVLFDEVPDCGDNAYWNGHNCIIIVEGRPDAQHPVDDPCRDGAVGYMKNGVWYDCFGGSIYSIWPSHSNFSSGSRGGHPHISMDDIPSISLRPHRRNRDACIENCRVACALHAIADQKDEIMDLGLATAGELTEPVQELSLTVARLYGKTANEVADWVEAVLEAKEQADELADEQEESEADNCFKSCMNNIGDITFPECQWIDPSK